MSDLPVPHPVVPEPAAELADEPALTRLYAAAVGPMGAAHYLPVFDRFEAVGRWRSSWNPVAAALTLNWLLWHRLWLAALGYGTALLLLALLVLGLGRYLLGLPLSIEMGLWLSGAALSVAVPGLWGNALMYVECQRRIKLALANSATLEQALAHLRLRTSSKKHALLLAGVNVLGLMVALLLYALWPAAAELEPEPEIRLPGPTRVLPVSAALAASAAASAPALAASSPASAPVSSALAASAAASVAVPAVSASARPASAVASAPASAASASLAAVSANARAASAAASAPAPVVAAKQQRIEIPDGRASALTAGVSRPKSPTVNPVPVSTPASRPSVAAVSAPAASRPSAPQAAAATSTAAATKATEASAASPLAGWVFVNVGLFADAGNARRAHAKLVAAGLPAVSDELTFAKGPRTRVRAGPFASRAQGQAAVAHIQALQLEAVLAP